MYKDRIALFEQASLRTGEEVTSESALVAALRREAWSYHERQSANTALVLGRGQEEAEIHSEMRAQACDIIDQQNQEMATGVQQQQALEHQLQVLLHHYHRALHEQESDQQSAREIIAEQYADAQRKEAQMYGHLENSLAAVQLSEHKMRGQFCEEVVTVLKI